MQRAREFQVELLSPAGGVENIFSTDSPRYRELRLDLTAWADGFQAFCFLGQWSAAAVAETTVTTC